MRDRRSAAREGATHMSDLVRDYYDGAVEIEWTRMDRHPLEFELSKRHIERRLRPASRILDLGGGPGRYALHYASLGHRVSLIDLSPRNVEFARRRAEELGLRLERATAGDARSLPWLEDESFDCVLCMGPLYHLELEAERAAVIAECRRLVARDGFMVFAFITEMAQALSLLKRHPERIAAWEEELEGTIARGANSDFDTGFTRARFVEPLGLRAYLEGFGLRVESVASAEGICCLREPELLSLPAEARERWIEFSFRHSERPSLLGAAHHVLCVARK
ncbi:MAG TPA: class I SAM-dependent methyltransferase [Spirochaetales bacterium]|nr:class I SAM-dependent methyltransferase [Spirochaetales bacterium]HRY54927.1 class I SAM-dependent methyltransferase [Spirochaetia bacterium]HRZ65273.1 class I SAM-dependent methyltransferase [Spirochaetia bacterium]